MDRQDVDDLIDGALVFVLTVAVLLLTYWIFGDDVTLW